MGVFLLILFLSQVLFGQAEDTSPYRVTSNEKHEMRIINSGMASLYARVDMIRRAQKSIDLESYIFKGDKSGKVIIQELAEAAKRGVKVRILVDKSPFDWKLNEHIASELKDRGIEVKYYNPTEPYQLRQVHFRNHRKLMIRDNEEVITGGRNIGDEYFDLGHRFNFLDRDVTIEGPIVEQMDKSFERYFNSNLSQDPKKPEEPKERITGEAGDPQFEQLKEKFKKDQRFAKGLFEKDKSTEYLLKVIDSHGKEMFEKHNKQVCPEVAFASDREGGKATDTYDEHHYSEHFRHLRKEIAKWIKEKAKDEVVIDTPYFLSNDLTKKLLDYLEQKKINVKLFTNSLASTDAIPVSTVFSSMIADFTSHDDFKAFVYKGKYSGEDTIYDEKARKSIWGTHAKSMIFSHDSFMIGTYNVDNRSSFYNAELAVFCSGSPELTKDIKENIEIRMKNSFRLNPTGSGEDCDIHAEVGTFKRLMYYILKIPSFMFQHLL